MYRSILSLCALAVVAASADAQRVAKDPAARAPTPAADSAAWAVILGADTLARESVIRTPRTLQGELRLLRPRAMAVRYTMFLHPGGTVDSLHTTTVDADVVARGTIVIRQDSAVLSAVAPGLAAPQVHRIPVSPGALPFINLSAGALDQILRRARSLRADSVRVPLVAGPQQLLATVRFVGRDSAVVDVGAALRAAVAPDGGLLGAVVPAQNVRFVRMTTGGASGGRARPRTDYSAPADAPYTAEQVTVRASDGVLLAGTLTLPRGARAGRPAPVVVTISGSGLQDRDSELVGIDGYRFFRQVADTLGRRGVGVLRLDDRGAGESAPGTADATTATFADDVRAALAWLRTRPEVDAGRLGLLGHSEGGSVAPMVAAEDSLVRAVALLAAPSRPGMELSAHQRRLALAHDPRVPPASRDSVFRVTQAQADSLVRSGAANAWTRYWWTFDPRPVVRRVRAAVLILHGETDAQVPVAQGEELAALLRSSGNPDVTLRRLPGVNHLFLEDPSGHWTGYATLPSRAVPPAVLGAIADFFASRLGRGT